MVSLSYREVFFPLFAQEHGFGEVRVAQTYLLCGLLVLYIGPVLSGWLLKRIGAFWSVLLASVAMGANMLVFVLLPNLGSVLAGVVILSVIISFAYTCQYTFFGQLPECEGYGEGRAMGIYSVVESMGQTAGPLAYGSLLSLGYRRGIGAAGVGMLALSAGFAFAIWRARRYYD